MQLPKSLGFAATPKNVIGLSVLLLMLAAVFAVLNTHKIKVVRAQASEAAAAHDAAERRRAAEEKQLKTREAAVTAERAKIAEAESKAAKAETELAQLQTEKADLQTKFQATQTEIASLQHRIEEAGGKSSENPGAPSTTELQAQLDEARRQLDAAEREKSFLSDKIRVAQERSSQLEEEKKRRQISAGKTGVRGTVLAVNQAYNFVVLNLGGRQGVEPNAEMLVLRDGTFIAKIRISSVEPSTAIGDIITSSLARGVQVQPGDIVIYAGTNS
jgi:multidrug efflux pump subunit AcrA (membrane-fusion protein)